MPLALAHGAPPRRRCRRAGPSSSRCRWTTGTPRSTRPTPRAAIARKVDGRAVADPEAVRGACRRARRRQQPGPRRRPRHRRQRRLGRRRRAGRAPAAAGLGHARRPAAAGSASPRATRTSAACCRRRSARSAQTLEGHDLILVVGSSVFPYYPHIPGPLLPEGATLVAITSDPDEAARAPMGDAIVADVRLTLEALLEAVPESTAAGAGAEPAARAEIPASDPLNASTVHTALAEVLPEDGDRRPRVAVEHAGPAQPAAALAPGQLLLRRRRRPRLRPRRRGRRPARPARPPGRLRRSARARPSTRSPPSGAPSPTRSPVTFLVLRNEEYAILKWFAEVEEVTGAPGLDLPALDVAAVAEGYGVNAHRVERPRRASRRTRPCARLLGSRSWSRSRSRPGCPSSRADGTARARPAALAPDGSRPGPRPGRARRRVAAAAARRAGGAARRRPRARPGHDLVRYASDASPYRLFPKAVVMARDADDVAKVLAYGARTGIPVTFRAGGTSLNGQGQSDGILVDVRRHFGGVAVEDDGALARVKPGTVLGHANRVLAPHGRKLGPDPASTDIACVGGVIANNSGGMRCGVTTGLLLDGQRDDPGRSHFLLDRYFFLRVYCCK